MKNERLIFRAEALQRYTQGRERSVLPHLTSPRTLLLLWVLMALLLAAGSTFLMIRVPVQATGVAVVLDSAAAAPGNATMAVFMPESSLPNLRVGQKVSWRFDAARERTARTLIAVEPELMSPAALRERFNFKGNLSSAINGPMAVAFTRLEPVGGEGSVDRYAGSVYRVEVEVGHRRVVSFLPLIGSFFRE